MGTTRTRNWISDAAGPQRDTANGDYTSYLPAPLTELPLVLPLELAQRLALAERRIRELAGPQSDRLATLARFLTRSEAIASSRIEGVAPSTQQAALAELALSESVRGLSEQARLVASNMTIVRDAVGQLGGSEAVTMNDVTQLQSALLEEEPRHHGLRTQQNWIGGGLWTPVGADFVPPPPEHVPAMMQDLLSYLNGATHGTLVQAALVHAQFETIHPFTDGNGRVGRALLHTVLERRGLMRGAVLPISLVLATLSDEYVDGLTNFRHLHPEGSPEANTAIIAWLEVFLRAVEIATHQAELLKGDVETLMVTWTERLSSYRRSKGLRPTPRAGSASAGLLRSLPEAPIVTANTLRRAHKVSFQSASQALEELTEAGILSRKSIDRGATAFIAREVLDLVTVRERALASTRFDTRASAPARPTPALPQKP